jgi:hypothetical protein
MTIRRGRAATTCWNMAAWLNFVLDPNGNNIEAIYHGAANRSSASVTIEFEG